VAVNSTKIPAVGKVPTGLEASMRQFLDSIKEALEVRLGQRGDKLDRAVTLRELHHGGVVHLVDGKTVYQADDQPSSVGFVGAAAVVQYNQRPPPAPTNLNAGGSLSHILLEWDRPRYDNHAYTEIWRAAVDDRSSAVLLGQSSHTLYADAVDPDSVYYYWARFISTSSVEGQWSSLAGIRGETGLIPGEKIKTLSADKISTTSLSAFSANLGTVTAGRMESASGKFVVDLTNEFVEVYQGDTLRVRIGRL